MNIPVELTLSAIQCDRVRQGQRLNVIDQITAGLQDYILSTLPTQQPTDEAAIANLGQHATNTQNTVTPESHEPLLEHERPVDIRLVDEQGQFIGLGAISLNGRLQPKKLIQL